MITEQNLTEAGYRRYSSSAILDKFSDFFYQKKFTDSEGIRYFIEFMHFPEMKFGNGTVMPECWQCTMNVNSPHMTFEQHRVDDIGVCERRCQTFFEHIDCEYYEKYEEAKA